MLEMTSPDEISYVQDYVDWLKYLKEASHFVYIGLMGLQNSA